MERVRASKAYPSTVLAFEFLVLTAGAARGGRRWTLRPGNGASRPSG